MDKKRHPKCKFQRRVAEKNGNVVAFGSFSQNIFSYAHGKFRNTPWAYAHPDRKIMEIEKVLGNIAAGQKDGKNIHIQIIFPDSEYWPLPWMLRDFHRIGWWDHVNRKVESAPVILIAPELEPDLIHKLYEQPMPGDRPLYVPIFKNAVELRPGASVQGYMKKSLWDQIDG